MRWSIVALFILLWLIGQVAGAGAFIHLLLFIALFISAVNLLAGRGTV